MERIRSIATFLLTLVLASPVFASAPCSCGLADVLGCVCCSDPAQCFCCPSSLREDGAARTDELRAGCDPGCKCCLIASGPEVFVVEPLHDWMPVAVSEWVRTAALSWSGEPAVLYEAALLPISHNRRQAWLSNWRK